MSHITFPRVVLAAVLVRFLVSPSWPTTLGLAVAGALVVLESWRVMVNRRVDELAGQVEAMGVQVQELSDLKPKLTQVLNRPPR